jgi:hypothetical protein
VTSDDGEEPAQRVDLSRDIEISSPDIAHVVVAAREAATTIDLGAEIGTLSCSLATSDVLGQALLDQARTSVRARAERAAEQLGARLGKLVNLNDNTVDTSAECTDFTLTASASATYELE